MNTKPYSLQEYKKVQLDKLSINPSIIQYIENCLMTEDEAAKHTFHRIIALNWSDGAEKLFDTMVDYYTHFVPVLYSFKEVNSIPISSFYTSSLNLVLKIIKLDFKFPYRKNTFHFSIVFNDKTSSDCFNSRITLDDIVGGVVSRRFNEKQELDLSNFCKDPEFLEKNINFCNISFLINFKILMIRMGRDTKSLNLSNNNLSTVPQGLVNFFIKGDLTEIKISNNNISSISELIGLRGKVEKLWLDGNPLCEEMSDTVSYVKQIAVKFPRLTELDGVKVHQHGLNLPYFKYFVQPLDNRTKIVSERFVNLFFNYYDTAPRKKLYVFYDVNATLSIATNFTESDKKDILQLVATSRNLLDPKNKPRGPDYKVFKGCVGCAGALNRLPRSLHDPHTFTVDVLLHTHGHMILVVDGIFEARQKNLPVPWYYQFRRTFVLKIRKSATMTSYSILNEMFNITFATEEQIKNSFKNRKEKQSFWALKNPDQDDIDTLCNTLSHITQLKRTEAESLLMLHNWDIQAALSQFLADLKQDKVSADKMVEDDDLSDISLDEID